MAAAIDLIDREGWNSLSLTGVARACGISAPATYKHFRDKESLVLAALEEVSGRVGAAVSDLVEDDPARSLGAMGSHLADFAAQHPHLFRFLFLSPWAVRPAVDRMVPGDVARAVSAPGAAAPGEVVPGRFAPAAVTQTGAAPGSVAPVVAPGVAPVVAPEVASPGTAPQEATEAGGRTPAARGTYPFLDITLSEVARLAEANPQGLDRDDLFLSLWSLLLGMCTLVASGAAVWDDAFISRVVAALVPPVGGQGR